MLLEKIHIYAGFFICYLFLWFIIGLNILFHTHGIYLLFSLGWVLVFSYLSRILYIVNHLRVDRLIILILLLLSIEIISKNDIESLTLNQISIENENDEIVDHYNIKQVEVNSKSITIAKIEEKDKNVNIGHNNNNDSNKLENKKMLSFDKKNAELDALVLENQLKKRSNLETTSYMKRTSKNIKDENEEDDAEKENPYDKKTIKNNINANSKKNDVYDSYMHVHIHEIFESVSDTMNFYISFSTWTTIMYTITWIILFVISLVNIYSLSNISKCCKWNGNHHAYSIHPYPDHSSSSSVMNPNVIYNEMNNRRHIPESMERKCNIGCDKDSVNDDINFIVYIMMLSGVINYNATNVTSNFGIIKQRRNLTVNANGKSKKSKRLVSEELGYILKEIKEHNTQTVISGGSNMKEIFQILGGHTKSTKLLVKKIDKEFPNILNDCLSGYGYNENEGTLTDWLILSLYYDINTIEHRDIENGYDVLDEDDYYYLDHDEYNEYENGEYYNNTRRIPETDDENRYSFQTTQHQHHNSYSSSSSVMSNPCCSSIGSIFRCAYLPGSHYRGHAHENRIKSRFIRFINALIVPNFGEDYMLGRLKDSKPNVKPMIDDVIYYLYSFILFVFITGFVIIGKQSPKNTEWISLIIRLHIVFCNWIFYIVIESFCINRKLYTIVLSICNIKIKIVEYLSMFVNKKESKSSSSVYEGNTTSNGEHYQPIHNKSKVTNNNLSLAHKQRNTQMYEQICQDDMNLFNYGILDGYVHFSLRNFVWFLPSIIFPLMIKSLYLVFSMELVLFIVIMAISIYEYTTINKKIMGRHTYTHLSNNTHHINKNNNNVRKIQRETHHKNQSGKREESRKTIYTKPSKKKNESDDNKHYSIIKVKKKQKERNKRSNETSDNTTHRSKEHINKDNDSEDSQEDSDEHVLDEDDAENMETDMFDTETKQNDRTGLEQQGGDEKIDTNNIFLNDGM